MKKVKGINILITGGTSGIGYQLAQLLAPSNNITVIGRKDSNTEIFPAGSNIKYVQLDLSNTDEIKKFAEEKIDFTRVDLLINNAAIQNQVFLEDQYYSLENIVDEIHTNFTSICLLSKLLLKNNPDRKVDILNVNSGLALVPKKTSAVYCATKAALSALTLSLRNQLQSRGWKIQQAYLPLVDTKLSQSLKKQRQKISALKAAEEIIYGYEKNIDDHHIGDVKKLRILNRLFPQLARKIMSQN